MPPISKDWLVRTRTGEILGPFTEKELLEELAVKTFSPEDEISRSGGQPWVSASLLQSRDKEEFTNTSTRNTSTASVTSDREPADFSSAPKRIPQEDELTPTPDASSLAKDRRASRPASKLEVKPLAVPILTAIVVSILAVTFLSKLRTSKNEHALPKFPHSSLLDAESDFTKKIYGLIQSGETGTALKNLNEYHEKVAKKESIDYLIPYAALLIMEGESLPRAKKFLEQVISSQVSPRLKSRAHHWLGYLFLSQDEGDMGESHFLESLQLNPKDAAARFNLGRSYLKQEKYSQALDYLQLAELEMPDLWLVHIYKGRAKVALGQMEEARQSFKTALQAAPDRWLSYIYYALFLVGVRDHAEAKLTLKKMLTRDPQYEIHSPPPFGFYQERLNYAEYLGAYTHIMEKGSYEDKEMGKLYITYLMNGGGDEDVRRFDTLGKNGSLTANVLALKVVLEKKNKPEEIQERLKVLPANLSNFGPYAYVLRGEAKARLGDNAGAMEDLQQALKMEPKSAIAHWAIATLLERQSKKNEARDEIERLLAHHPHYIPALLSAPKY